MEAMDLPGTVIPILLLSLGVSLSATLLASIIGLPLAALLGIARFRGRSGLIVSVNALLGLPPVVVGLALYLLLSHSGPLGDLRLLFTPYAMVIAQAVLATPIVAAVAHRALESAWIDYGDAFLSLGFTRLRSVPHIFAIAGAEISTAILAGFGRTISEVGAVLIVGGNIAGVTRTMTTTITLETSKGNFALALTLGLILIAISAAVSAAAFFSAGPLLRGRSEARR
jgi:tungstate transport system permease protein